MRTFFLDLASHDGLLACVTDDAVVAQVTVSNRTADAELLPLMEKTMKDAGWQMKEIERIACVTGPGGFTSQRVAVTLGNTLAWGLHVPIAGIHLSELYAARCLCHPSSPLTMTPDDFFWLHSTKKTLLFIRGFGAYTKQCPDAVPVSLEDLQAITHKLQPRFIGELLPEHEQAIVAQGAERVAIETLEQTLPRFLSPVRYEEKPLEPWYGRGW